jgi:hypothetical protein
VTAQEIQDALALLDASANDWTIPQAVTILEISRQILGFDPSIGQQSAAYGGKSPEGWYGQHIAVGRMRTTLQEMVEAGVVTEIIGKDNRTVRTPYRGGPKGRSYLLTATHEAAAANRAAELRDRQRKDLRVAEEREFIAAHAAEIQAGYEARCAAAGISPTLESTTEGRS